MDFTGTGKADTLAGAFSLVGLLVLGACAEPLLAQTNAARPLEPSAEDCVLSIAPSNLQLQRGADHQLSVTMRGCDASSVDNPEVEWSSTRPFVAIAHDDGRVQARGLGRTTIVARRGSLRDSARVMVVDLEGSATAQNGQRTRRPEGYENLTRRPFDQLVEDGWTASGNFEVVETTIAPGQRSRVGVVHFSPGFEGGRTPGWTTRDGLESFDSRELYLTFRVKLSDNWQSPGSGVSKIGYVWMHGNPVVFPINWTYGHRRIQSQVRIQGTPDGSRNLYPNVRDVEVRRGEWHRWEILLIANTGSRHDGQVHWWIDGEKVGQYRDVIFGGFKQSKAWQKFAFRPTWGSDKDTVRTEMSISMDSVSVSAPPSARP